MSGILKLKEEVAKYVVFVKCCACGASRYIGAAIEGEWYYHTMTHAIFCNGCSNSIGLFEGSCGRGQHITNNYGGTAVTGTCQRCGETVAL